MKKRKINWAINKVVTLFIVTNIIPVYGIYSATAQTMTTNEAKVVAVVAAESNAIKALELFADQDNKEEQLQKKYPNCIFYIGLMEGSYEIEQNVVHPQRGTTVIIFINQPIFGVLDKVFTDYRNPGDALKIGNTDTKVISNKKGELILKTQ